ncbi:hypothetical protein K1719_008270 [Acacia pycnantha]|nr:hypothetical protein K1719_008270 [Acacia pycnantha]
MLKWGIERKLRKSVGGMGASGRDFDCLRCFSPPPPRTSDPPPRHCPFGHPLPPQFTTLLPPHRYFRLFLASSSSGAVISSSPWSGQFLPFLFQSPAPLPFPAGKLPLFSLIFPFLVYMLKWFLRILKDKIKNPSYVEGSIAEAFLVKEATKFASYDYPPKMISRWRGVPCNNDGGDTSDQISIFNFSGRVMGKHCRSTLEGRDERVMEWYILKNCEEVAPYIKYFFNWVQLTNPLMSDSKVEQFRNSEFP